MDYSNGQDTFLRNERSGNAILHGSFDQERHGTGNGSAQNPLQSTPNITRIQPSETQMAILQGAVTNPNCQGLASSPNQNAIRILQDMCNATSHSATQANGGFGTPSSTRKSRTDRTPGTDTTHGAFTLESCSVGTATGVRARQ